MEILRRKSLIVILSVILPKLLFAQVGIGTTNPQKDLHIAGSTSTIRIDGLNATNNTNNLGVSGETYPVHVNATGDLVIPPSPASCEALVLDNNVISGTLEVTSNNPSVSGGATLQQLFTKNFTITRTCLVVINYSLPFLVARPDNTAMSDGKAKIIDSYFLLEKDGVADPTWRALSGQSYCNANASGSSASGTLINSGSYTAILTPGNYVLKMYTAAFAGPYSAGTTTQVFKAIYNTNETITVYAVY